MDILVCPFCGVLPQTSVDDDDMTWMYCQDCNIKFPAWHWQTRIPNNKCQQQRDALAEVLIFLSTAIMPEDRTYDNWGWCRMHRDILTDFDNRVKAALAMLDDGFPP